MDDRNGPAASTRSDQPCCARAPARLSTRQTGGRDSEPGAGRRDREPPPPWPRGEVRGAPATMYRGELRADLSSSARSCESVGVASFPRAVEAEAMSVLVDTN